MRGAAALLVALATALASAAASPVEASDGGAPKAKPVPRIPFRLALTQPRSLAHEHAVPVVSISTAHRYSLFLLKVSLTEPRVYGTAAAARGGFPEGIPPARNRIAELRSRTVVKYNVTNRIFFVGEAQGSRLRMLRLTLARFFGGIEVGAHPPRDRYTPMSESEAAFLRARERTVRRALAPRLTFPGLSLNLGGISIQAGVRVRLF